MPLFHVQDPDRPMYVVAASYGAAVDRYLAVVAAENECPVEDCDLPQGVNFVCEDSEFLPAPADADLSAADTVRARIQGLRK